MSMTVPPSYKTSEKLMRLEHEYTDDELLNELRRRGRFARVEVDEVVPDRYVNDGFPLEPQIRAIWKIAALEGAKLHANGTGVPAGAKVQNGYVIKDIFKETGRRLAFTLNYVIDKP